MWKRNFEIVSKKAKRLCPDERGSASAELMVVIPIFVLFIVGILWFAGFAYYHLALLTTANDCAVMVAHEPGQYANAAELVQGAYSIEAYIVGHSETGVGFVACSASTSWSPYALRYTIHIPLQPYRSLWP